MRFTVGYGTPHHMEHRECDTPAKARGELQKRLDARIQWAAIHNGKLHDEMQAARQEIKSTPIQNLKVGEQRTWTHVDDYTGVTFVFTLRKDST